MDRASGLDFRADDPAVLDIEQGKPARGREENLVSPRRASVN